MYSDTQHIFKVSLIVKGQTREIAEREVVTRLNQWFNADAGDTAPYKDGSLLHWVWEQEPE